MNTSIAIFATATMSAARNMNKERYNFLAETLKKYVSNSEEYEKLLHEIRTRFNFNPEASTYKQKTAMNYVNKNREAKREKDREYYYRKKAAKALLDTHPNFPNKSSLTV